MLAVPANALVVTDDKAEIAPAGISARAGTDATWDWSDVSWTTTSDEEFTGAPVEVCNATSSTP
jgi:hypothetical protein